MRKNSSPKFRNCSPRIPNYEKSISSNLRKQSKSHQIIAILCHFAPLCSKRFQKSKNRNKFKFPLKYTGKNIDRRIIMVYNDYKRYNCYIFETNFEVKQMGKKPLNENQVKTLRKIVKDKPLHELLLNLSVDLMLRSSDLLNLKISDVLNESGSVKTEVKVRQKKTGKNTLSIPLSKNSIDAIKKYLLEREQDDYIFKGQMSHFTRKPISTQQYAKIVKKWVRELGVEDVSEYSTHSMRKVKATVIYNRTKNVDAVRRLLGQSSVTVLFFRNIQMKLFQQIDMSCSNL